MHTHSDVHLRSHTNPEGSQRGEGSITWLPSFAHKRHFLHIASLPLFAFYLISSGALPLPPPHPAHPLALSDLRPPRSTPVFPGPSCSSCRLPRSSTVLMTLSKEATLFCVFVFGSITVHFTKSALMNSPEGSVNVFWWVSCGRLAHAYVSLRFCVSADASVNTGAPLHPPDGFSSKTQLFCLPFKPAYFSCLPMGCPVSYFMIS